MNTEQKAEAWLALNTDEIETARDIITALLKEREVLLESLKEVTTQYRNVRRAENYPTANSLSIDKAEQAIAMCEAGA